MPDENGELFCWESEPLPNIPLFNPVDFKPGEVIKSWYSGIVYVVKRHSTVSFLKDQNGFVHEFNSDNNRHFYKTDRQLNLFNR